MTTTATITAHQDRWELIADRLWKLPELGWAIAEANPDLAGYLILPAGLALVIPELRSLRRPLTAANPAREDNGEFIQLPPPPPSSVPPSSGGGGSVVFPIEISQGGTGAVTAQQALLNLGAVALASKGVPGGVMPLDGGGIAPLINLPPFQSPLTFPISILQGGTGGITASEARANIGAIALSDVPASIPPSAIGVTIAPIVSGLVPVGNLPPYPTLGSLGGVSLATNQTITGAKIFTGFTTLGDNVAIKKKFFSGTTSATQGSSVSIAHGITGGVPKIVSITGIITYVAGNFVVMNSPQVGFQVAISGNDTNINVYNTPSPNSASVLSKPFVLILEYIA